MHWWNQVGIVIVVVYGIALVVFAAATLMNDCSDEGSKLLAKMFFVLLFFIAVFMSLI